MSIGMRYQSGFEYTQQMMFATGLNENESVIQTALSLGDMNKTACHI